MSAEFWVGPSSDPDRVRLGPAAASGAEGVLYRGFLGVGAGAVQIAVKMLQPGHLDRLGEWTTRWREQAELLRRVEVPGLVRVRGGFVGPLPHTRGNADPSTSSLYLLMDWVEGVSLDRWVRSVDDPDPEQLLLALVPVAVALDLLHSGAATGGLVVLHRDVKPANILVRPGGDTVLVDVGSVRGLLDDQRRSGIVGTAGYIAPEVRVDAAYGPAADRYSLGAVAFFLLTGEEPPVAAATGELRTKLTHAPLLEGRNDVAQHVLAMLDADPERRPTPLANWVAQLRRSSLVAIPADVGLPPRAPGRNPTIEQPVLPALPDVPSPGRDDWWRRRTPRRLAAGALVCLVLLAGGIIFQVARAPANRGGANPGPGLAVQAAPTTTTIDAPTTTSEQPTTVPVEPSTTTATKSASTTRPTTAAQVAPATSPPVTNPSPFPTEVPPTFELPTTTPPEPTTTP